jgi:hypothetical protein
MAKKQSAQDIKDILVVGGINAKGYGTVAKLVMQDSNLSIQAKALYAYICSYTGGGTVAWPGRDKICHDLNINKDSYHKYLKELKVHDYIKTVPRREGGKYKGNEFHIVQFPKPCPKISDTVENQQKQGFEPCPKKPDTVKPDTVFSDTNNNSINKEEEEEEERHKLTDEEVQDIVNTYRLQIGDKFENQIHFENMLSWLFLRAEQHSVKNVIVAIHRLKDRMAMQNAKEIKSVIRWLDSCIKDPDSYPPVVSFEGTTQRQRKKPNKKRHSSWDEDKRQKLYDALLMS